MRWLVLALVACKGPPTEVPLEPDTDGDGFRADVDCNDTDPAVFPGAPEYCDGLDQNCDGDTADTSASHIEGGAAGFDLAETVSLASAGDVIIACAGTHPPVTTDGITQVQLNALCHTGFLPVAFRY